MASFFPSIGEHRRVELGGRLRRRRRRRDRNIVADNARRLLLIIAAVCHRSAGGGGCVRRSGHKEGWFSICGIEAARSKGLTVKMATNYSRSTAGRAAARERERRGRKRIRFAYLMEEPIMRPRVRPWCLNNPAPHVDVESPRARGPSTIIESAVAAPHRSPRHGGWID